MLILLLKDLSYSDQVEYLIRNHIASGKIKKVYLIFSSSHYLTLSENFLTFIKYIQLKFYYLLNNPIEVLFLKNHSELELLAIPVNPTNKLISNMPILPQQIMGYSHFYSKHLQNIINYCNNYNPNEVIEVKANKNIILKFYGNQPIFAYGLAKKIAVKLLTNNLTKLELNLIIDYIDDSLKLSCWQQIYLLEKLYIFTGCRIIIKNNPELVTSVEDLVITINLTNTPKKIELNSQEKIVIQEFEGAKDEYKWSDIMTKRLESLLLLLYPSPATPSSIKKIHINEVYGLLRQTLTDSHTSLIIEESPKPVAYFKLNDRKWHLRPLVNPKFYLKNNIYWPPYCPLNKNNKFIPTIYKDINWYQLRYLTPRWKGTVLNPKIFGIVKPIVICYKLHSELIRRSRAVFINDQQPISNNLYNLALFYKVPIFTINLRDLRNKCDSTEICKAFFDTDCLLFNKPVILYLKLFDNRIVTVNSKTIIKFKHLSYLLANQSPALASSF